MKFCRRLAISCIRSLWGCEQTEVSVNSVRLNVCNPFGALSVPSDAFVSARVTPIFPSVPLILRGCRRAQVLPSVVCAVGILMVNLKFRPFSCHPKPDDAMGHAKMTVGPNLDPTALRISTDISSNLPLAWPNPPSQRSGFRIVIKQLSRPLGRQVGQRPLVASGGHGLAALASARSRYARLARAGFWYLRTGFCSLITRVGGSASRQLSMTRRINSGIVIPRPLALTLSHSNWGPVMVSLIRSFAMRATIGPYVVPVNGAL